MFVLNSLFINLLFIYWLLAFLSLFITFITGIIVGTLRNYHEQIPFFAKIKSLFYFSKVLHQMVIFFLEKKITISNSNFFTKKSKRKNTLQQITISYYLMTRGIIKNDNFLKLWRSLFYHYCMENRKDIKRYQINSIFHRSSFKKFWSVDVCH